MSEAELFQSAQGVWSNAISLLVVQITLLSGYLVAAYVIGKELTSSQVTIVNGLYILLSSFVLMGVYTFSNRATELANLSIAMSETRELAPQNWIPLGMVIIFSVCLAASLKFMWDVRHQNGKNDS